MVQSEFGFQSDHEAKRERNHHPHVSHLLCFYDRPFALQKECIQLPFPRWRDEIWLRNTLLHSYDHVDILIASIVQLTSKTVEEHKKLNLTLISVTIVRASAYGH